MRARCHATPHVPRPEAQKSRPRKSRGPRAQFPVSSLRYPVVRVQSLESRVLPGEGGLRQAPVQRRVECQMPDWTAAGEFEVLEKGCFERGLDDPVCERGRPGAGEPGSTRRCCLGRAAPSDSSTSGETGGPTPHIRKVIWLLPFPPTMQYRIDGRQKTMHERMKPCGVGTVVERGARHRCGVVWCDEYYVRADCTLRVARPQLAATSSNKLQATAKGRKERKDCMLAGGNNQQQRVSPRMAIGRAGNDGRSGFCIVQFGKSACQVSAGAVATRACL